MGYDEYLGTSIPEDSNGGPTLLQDDAHQYLTRRFLETFGHEKAEAVIEFKNVVEESLVGFHITQEGTFRYVNKRFCQIHGYTYRELVNKMGPVDLVLPEDRHKVELSLRQRLAGERDHTQYEFRSLRKDGKVITLKVMGSRTVYQGRPAASATCIDITKERALEAQLYHSQKLEAIGQLAGGVAHDFNNILSAVIGYASLLQMKMGAEDPLRGYTDQILTASYRAAQLTQSLLAFGRKQVINLTPCKLNTVVPGVEKLLKRLLTEDIELKTVVSEEELTILADVTQIDQVLINLSTNARDAMPDGGLLAIEAMAVDLDAGFVEARGLPHAGKYALISVSDSGLGMSEKTRQRIFEPFFTTKEMGKGTGLGLSIVYGIIQQHNGFIDVYSEPGHGTTFNIYIPLVNRNVENVAKRDFTSRPGTEMVLLAEDDAEVRRLMRTVLSEHGYSIIEAEDGMEAVNMFLRHKGTIGLVVLDAVMPRKNGKEVYEVIRRMDPTVKVLFTSGYTDDIVHQKGRLNGDLDYIGKPVAPDVFLHKVREVLDR